MTEKLLQFHGKSLFDFNIQSQSFLTLVHEAKKFHLAMTVEERRTEDPRPHIKDVSEKDL